MNRAARLFAVLAVAFTGVAWAQEVESSPPVYDGLSTLWILIAAAMVFLMQAGFGMVESGLIRTKNASNVLMKNLLDFCFAALGFYVFGYAIMYGSEGPFVGTE
ncbi:MAG: ammonium transporter, partial [Acidobacteriota bacterium]